MTAIASRPARPFLPSEIRRDKPGPVVGRAALVAAKAAFSHSSTDAVAAKEYPNDHIVPAIVSKSTVSPASTTGWAGELAASTTVNFIGSMTGQSAAARLLDASTKLTFDGKNQINIPSRALAPSSDVAWVAELSPVPVWPPGRACELRHRTSGHLVL
jgi:hypothetical protein